MQIQAVGDTLKAFYFERMRNSHLVVCVLTQVCRCRIALAEGGCVLRLEIIVTEVLVRRHFAKL